VTAFLSAATARHAVEIHAGDARLHAFVRIGQLRKRSPAVFGKSDFRARNAPEGRRDDLPLRERRV
jgi:hypothetical protein